MGYYLGIDIGTTYTAAAVWRDGRCDVASLGNRAPTIPSVVFLRDDGTVLIGEAAARRAASEPASVAREFKRRVGDPTPVIVGGTPYSADALMAQLLRAVVDLVIEAEGGPARRHRGDAPGQLGPLQARPAAPGHPAGRPRRRRHGVRARGRRHPLRLPVPGRARCGHRRLRPRRRHLRRRGAAQDGRGWDVLGTPEGIERLGGVDFDVAVYHHVATAISPALDELSPDDPAAVAAVARLRQECVDAKEALSADSDVSIPVLLPKLQTEVRLTRAEYEQMVRPALADTITSLNRALRSARRRAGRRHRRAAGRRVVAHAARRRAGLVGPRPAGGGGRPPQVRRGARRRDHRGGGRGTDRGGRPHLRDHATGRGRARTSSPRPPSRRHPPRPPRPPRRRPWRRRPTRRPRSHAPPGPRPAPKPRRPPLRPGPPATSTHRAAREAPGRRRSHPVQQRRDRPRSAALGGTRDPRSVMVPYERRPPAARLGRSPARCCGRRRCTAEAWWPRRVAPRGGRAERGARRRRRGGRGHPRHGGGDDDPARRGRPPPTPRRHDGRARDHGDHRPPTPDRPVRGDRHGRVRRRPVPGELPGHRVRAATRRTRFAARPLLPRHHRPENAGTNGTRHRRLGR